MNLQARHICTQMRAYCDTASVLEGRVHSVFRRVCNLEFPGLPIMSLTTAEIPVKPMAAQLIPSRPDSFLELGLQQGISVRCANLMFSFPVAGLQVSLVGAAVQDCGMPDFFPVSGSLSAEKRSGLRQCLLSANPQGVLPLLKIWDPQLPVCDNPVSAFLKERVRCLFDAAVRLDFPALESCTAQVAGCGPGLTPSSDDLLVGLMSSLLYASVCYGLPHDNIRNINQALVEGARGKTLPLSFEMLEQAARGYLPEDLHGLLQALWGSRPCSIQETAESVLNYGETSGSDTLTGICMGIFLADALRTSLQDPGSQLPQ